MRRVLSKTFLAVFFFMSFILTTSVMAQSTDTSFQQAVAAYQQAPDPSGAEKVIKLAVAMPQLPAVPEEARKHNIKGGALSKEAKSPEDFIQVRDEFAQAARLAPWWPDARLNLALALESVGDYPSAMANLKLYQLFKLSDADARSVQDKIYVLEAKQEKAAKESSPEAVAAQDQKKSEDWLTKLDGRRYTVRGANGTAVIDIKGKVFVLGGIQDFNGRYDEAGENSRIEIRGRETRSVYTSRFFNSTIDQTYIISEDGERITRRYRSGDGSVQENIYLWQK